MPKKHRSFTKQRTSSKTLQKNLLIGVGIVIGVVAVVAIIASQSAPIDMSFPAREMGERSAKVIVEEYSDFQCPYCGLFATTAEVQFREQYVRTGRVYFIFRNYPVVGQESTLAALAAMCAGDQNMFWEYHDLLFRNQAGENLGNFNTARLQAFAVQLNLDSMRFNQCLNNQSHADVLNADIQRGRALRIGGTPTFYVNGKMVTGTELDFQWLFDAIDRALITAGG